ncbi:nucleotidyltransferase family protein [Bdellovibrio sp. HCB-110]|uniref:nucleotidyltransferase family protein n=1 Tax=Bdellovibrio sp. HCB-110 TaxID=3391182 RepID=UPI0039B4EF44
MNNWGRFKVHPEDSIINALKVIEAGGLKFSVVVGDDGKLCGTLTDGDIRRGILNGMALQEKVSKVMNVKPIVVSSKMNDNETLNLLRKSQINHLPRIDANGRLVGIASIDELQEENSLRENAVILMVGGLGARLGELTANCPKPMLKVGEKPILEIIIENFKKAGFKNFFLSVNYMSNVIEEYFGNGERFGIRIQYLREKSRMGTAGSLSLYEPINDLPVVVMNGDLLTQVDFVSLLDHHLQNEFDAMMCVRQYDHQIPFGVVHVDKGEMSYLEEKPVHSYLVNAGIYALKPSILKHIPPDSYLDMPSFLSDLKIRNGRVGVFPIHEYWLDIGRKDDFIKAELEYLNRFK